MSYINARRIGVCLLISLIAILAISPIAANYGNAYAACNHHFVYTYRNNTDHIQKCTQCGMKGTYKHYYLASFNSNGKYHWQYCKFCNHRAYKEKHRFNKFGICKVCGYMK